VLGHISCGDDDLSIGDAVVLKEHDLEEFVDALVVVDALCDRVDQLDEGLGISVAWSGFASDEDHAGHELGSSLRLWGVQNLKVAMDHIEDVHVLTLVLVDALNQHIVHGIKTNLNSLSFLDVLLEGPLIFQFNSLEPANKFGLCGLADDLLDHPHVGDPVVLISDCVRDQLREARVAAVQPASRGDSISHVEELMRPHLVEI